MSRKQDQYRKEIVPAMMGEFKYSSSMQVPKLKKIVLNVGVGEAVNNSKAMDFVVYALSQMSGQKPVVTKTKKSIATYKTRKGIPIGCMVTMRNERMYEFFDRLVSIALPRVRDFRGVPIRGFDGRGSYTMGLKEQIVFPEVVMEKLDKVRGLDITFVTDAKTDEEGRALLTHLGMPFRKAA